MLFSSATYSSDLNESYPNLILCFWFFIIFSISIQSESTPLGSIRLDASSADNPFDY